MDFNTKTAGSGETPGAGAQNAEGEG